MGAVEDLSIEKDVLNIIITFQAVCNVKRERKIIAWAIIDSAF